MHDDEGDAEDTVLRPVRDARPGDPRPTSDDDLDDTVLRPGRRRPDSGRGTTEAAEHDEDRDDLDDTVLRPPVRRGRHAAPDSVPWDVDDTVVRPARGPRPGAAVGEDLDHTVLRPGRQRPASPPRRFPIGGAPAASGRVDATSAPETPAPAGPTADAPVPAGPDQGLQAVPGVAERVPSIRVGDRVVRLERTVVLGRRPAPPRVVRGPAPELVTVPSPRHQVSSSHLAVSAAGTTVVVEDLGSTNGTVIRPVGAAPIRMPSGGSMVVLTGTVVEIGDGNSIEILSPHLRVHPQVGVSDRADPWPPASNPRHAPRAESDPDT